jgi:hypothetical protein
MRPRASGAVLTSDLEVLARLEVGEKVRKTTTSLLMMESAGRTSEGDSVRCSHIDPGGGAARGHEPGGARTC